MDSPLPPDFQDTDSLVDHEVDIEQVILALILLTERGYNGRLSQVYGVISSRLPEIRRAGFRLSTGDARRFRDLLNGLDGVTADIARDLSNQAVRNIRLIAREDARFWARRTGAPVPSAADVRASLAERRYLGRTLDEDAARLQQAVRNIIRDAVSEGVSAGETLEQVITRLRGTRANGFRDGANTRIRRALRQFITTGADHATSVARELIGRQVFRDPRPYATHVSILDSRTSHICLPLAGRVYRSLRDVRWPPLHPNCRSRIWIGNGVVPQGVTGQEWLSRQTEARQIEILGPTRAALFRAGDLTVDQLIDPQTLRPLTLREIRRRRQNRRGA